MCFLQEAILVFESGITKSELGASFAISGPQGKALFLVVGEDLRQVRADCQGSPIIHCRVFLGSHVVYPRPVISGSSPYSLRSTCIYCSFAQVFMECVHCVGLNREYKCELYQGSDPTRSLPEKERMMVTHKKYQY